MHNTEKVPSFVTANLLTSHFTTCRFAGQITAKVSILLINSAWQLRSDMWEMGSDMQNFFTCSSWNVCRRLILLFQCKFYQEKKLLQHKQVVLEQCIPEIGLLSFLLAMASTNLFSSSLLSASLFLRS